MEIREWLGGSGNQTSVDVTDLGKVRQPLTSELGRPKDTRTHVVL